MTEIQNPKQLASDLIWDLDIEIWNLPALLNRTLDFTENVMNESLMANNFILSVTI